SRSTLFPYTTLFRSKEKLPEMYNDAHAALRGFAKSTVHGSVVLSAGMNPKLYSYFEDFDCFYPDQNGVIEKKVILKVSDYRSARSEEHTSELQSREN